jgi:hypothetical protein
VTDPLEGRYGSPSVAALAVQVNGLSRDVEALAARVDVLARTQEEHAVVLEGITELRGQVEEIVALLSEDGKTSPSEWFWLTMDERAGEEKFSELFDWVETVLRPQYPGYLAQQIQLCWPNHPEARWELAWLYQLWSFAYLSKRAAPKDAADWHDRWAPGVIRRLGAVMNRCQGDCQQHRGPSRPGTGKDRVAT